MIGLEISLHIGWRCDNLLVGDVTAYCRVGDGAVC